LIFYKHRIIAEQKRSYQQLKACLAPKNAAKTFCLLVCDAETQTTSLRRLNKTNLILKTFGKSSPLSD